MTSKHKILFIINPISGIGKKNTIPPVIERYLSKDNFEWRIQYTERRNHAAVIASEEKHNFDAIIAVGGDGSVNEIGSALINSNCALGIIPCGSGNGVARHLEVPLVLEKAIQRIAKFKKVVIDTGCVNKRPFIGTCGFGFDAHIAHKFDSFGKRGFISYARLVLNEFKGFQSPTFNIKGEDFDLTKTALMCSVANSSQFGNGFTISPNSDIQDGIFELVFLEKFKWLNAFGITRKFFSKSIHTSNHFSSVAFNSSVIIKLIKDQTFYYHIDGEPAEAAGEFKITVHPKSLTII